MYELVCKTPSLRTYNDDINCNGNGQLLLIARNTFRVSLIVKTDLWHKRSIVMHYQKKGLLLQFITDEFYHQKNARHKKRRIEWAEAYYDLNDF